MGLFDFTIITYVGDYKKYCKYVSSNFDDDSGATDNAPIWGDAPRGMCALKTGYCPIIYIPRLPEHPREYATLTHEATHAVMHLLRWAALAVNEDTEEVLCHSTAHIVNDVLLKLTNKKKG